MSKGNRDSRELLLSDDDGEVRAVVEKPKPGLREHAGRYRTLVSTPELLVLRRCGGRDEEPVPRVLMAGEIVSPSTILEMVSIISAAHWVGHLDIYAQDSRRTLGFYKGVLRHAKSDHLEDRLDKVLFRTGTLSPSQMEAAMRDIQPDQRFGQVLVERGLLDRQQLFEALRQQMEHILLAAVLEQEGSYVFTLAEGAAAPPTATAHIPLQQLLLIAAERVDRFSIFRRLVPDPDLSPEVLPGVEVAHLEPRARLVLGHASDGRTLREIASETWLGRFQATEVVYDLVRRGQVELRLPQHGAEEKARALVAPFNEALQEIYEAVSGHAGVERVRRDLDQWLETSPHEEVLGRSLDGDGLCTWGRIAETLRTSGTRYAAEEIRHALHELVSFALFGASLGLPRAEERELAARIQKRIEAT